MTTRSPQTPPPPAGLPTVSLGPMGTVTALSLAPMSGVTDSAFRRLVLEASGRAVGWVVSEFLSVELLTRKTMQSAVRLAFHDSERPIGLQIFGSDPETMAEAARIIEATGADYVDVNAGCPAPKVVRKGGGAGLLRDLDTLRRVLEGVRGAVTIPVGLKIRHGWDASSIVALETLRIAEGEGVDLLAVHGRTREALYRGLADWDVVAQLRAEARIPVVGSGDVATADDVAERFASESADALMIGRAAIVNPWIFRQAADVAAGRPPFAPTWGDRLRLLERYVTLLREAYPAQTVLGRFRGMVNRQMKALPDVATVRVPCLKEATPEAMLKRLRRYLSERGLADSGGRDVVAA